MRLFSIILWHHFAYMIISLALLGYGASGAVADRSPRARVQQRFAPLFMRGRRAVRRQRDRLLPAGAARAVQSAGNPLGSAPAGAPAGRLPAAARAVPVRRRLRLHGLRAFARQAPAHLQLRHPRRRRGMPGHRAALFVLSPQDALKLIGAPGVRRRGGRVARMRRARGAGRRSRCWSLRRLPLLLPRSLGRARDVAVQGAVADACAFPAHGSLRNARARWASSAWSRARAAPLRHAPGLSLNATAEPPPQLGVFIDGEGLSALTRFDGRRESLAHLGPVTSALPYHLLRRPRVLVLGAGAGADVLQAHYHGARQIDAVELNPQVVDLVRSARFGGIYSGGPFGAAGVRVHIGRSARLRRRQHGTLRPDPGGAARFVQRVLGRPVRAVGELPVHGRSPAGRTCDHLRARRPAGDHALGHAAAARCAQALRRGGGGAGALGRRRPRRRSSRWCAAGRPARCSSRTAPSTPPTSRRSRRSAASARSTSRSIPACGAAEANRYNVVDAPDLFDGATALLGPGRDEFIERYKFHDRPGHRRQAALLPLLQVALAARAAVAEGAGRPAAAGMGLSGARRDAGPGGAREPAADRACRSGSRAAGARRRDRVPRPDRAPRRSPTSLRSASPSCSSRSRSSRSSSCSCAPAVRGGGRAVCVPPLCRIGQPLFAALKRGPKRPRGQGSAGRSRRSAPSRSAISSSSRCCSDTCAPSGSAADPDRDGADRTAGVRDGNAVSARARAARGTRGAADSVGVEHQCVRIGRGSDSRDGARDPPGLRGGDRARRAALRDGVPGLALSGPKRRRKRSPDFRQMPKHGSLVAEIESNQEVTHDAIARPHRDRRSRPHGTAARAEPRAPRAGCEARRRLQPGGGRARVGPRHAWRRRRLHASTRRCSRIRGSTRSSS